MGLTSEDKRRLKARLFKELDKCTVVSLGLDPGQLQYLADDLVQVVVQESDRWVRHNHRIRPVDSEQEYSL